MQETVLSAALSRYGGVYNTKLFEIVQHFHSLQELFEGWKNNAFDIPKPLREIIDRSWQSSQLYDMERALNDNAITSYHVNDSDFPPLLREISDPPYVLYIKGDSSCLTKCIPLSCVGTRNITSYGRRAVNHLLMPLAPYQICIISGLALGIDAEVHRTALNNEIKTVGVLGGGLDRYEPLANKYLGESIVASACLVSEYPPGVRPQKHHFLERNRIIAGLARATIVIEGKPNSGALVTAKYALQYGREVGCVPGDIFLATSEGTNGLLTDGAWCITESDTILAMLGIENLPDNKNAIKPKNQVHALLLDAPQATDALQAKLNVSIQAVQQQLTVLELEGVLQQLPTGEYFITR